MTAALGAAILSAIFYGVASALQARGTKLPFIAGTVLDIAGFGTQLLALRTLPLFVVQAAQAGNLAVTALAAIPLLGVRLGARQWAAVLGVCAGIALLGAASGPEGSAHASFRTRVFLLVAAAILGLAGLAAGRLKTGAGAIALGVVAGLGFGVTALAVRALPTLSMLSLVRDPAAYAVALSGLAAFLSFAVGLQRGAVTTISALIIIGETTLPALIGILVWHDHTRPGWTVPALIGFALAVAGALALARFAQPEKSGPEKSGPEKSVPETATP